jgi:hypothetical protein
LVIVIVGELLGDDVGGTVAGEVGLSEGSSVVVGAVVMFNEVELGAEDTVGVWLAAFVGFSVDIGSGDGASVSEIEFDGT